MLGCCTAQRAVQWSVFHNIYFHAWVLHGPEGCAVVRLSQHLSPCLGAARPRGLCSGPSFTTSISMLGCCTAQRAVQWSLLQNTYLHACVLHGLEGCAVVSLNKHISLAVAAADFISSGFAALLLHQHQRPLRPLLRGANKAYVCPYHDMVLHRRCI